MSTQTEPQPASCTCGKVRYLTRKLARQTVRRLEARTSRQPGGRRLRAYQCDGGFWHIGHVSPEVANGNLTREEWYDGMLIAGWKQQCANCAIGIEAGDKIYRNQGIARHAECPPPQ